MPARFNAQAAGAAKLSLTLSPEAAEELRLLAETASLTLAELVRQSLGIYRFVDGLSEDEELCVRDRRTGEITRVALVRV